MNSFVGSVPSRRSRWLAVALVSIVTGATLLVFPVAQVPLAASPTLLTIYLTLAASADAVTAFLFFSQARVGRSVPLMLLGSGYLYSALAICVHTATFPGIFTPDGLFGATTQTAVWFWVWWHGGFPLFVLAYAVARARDLDRRHDPRSSAPLIAGFVAAVVLAVAACSALTLWDARLLPVLIHKGSYGLLMKTGLGPLVLLSIVAGIAAVLRYTRLRTVTDVWLAVALFASLLDCVLTLVGGARFSIGWYLARVESLLASTIVLLSFFAAIDGLTARLSRLSRIDALTGLANRRAFEEGLESAAALSARMRRPLSLLMLDVDAFKGYNDAYGHQLGDEALRSVAACIATSLGRRTDLAARYGGEEFAVVLPATGADGAARLAERIRAAVAALVIPHPGSDHAVVTVSIGSGTLDPEALIAQHGEESLIRIADAALYRAKAGGRNTVVAGSSDDRGARDGSGRVPELLAAAD
jgi:diguanylate cyclase (GGDEF)-like protein